MKTTQILRHLAFGLATVLTASTSYAQTEAPKDKPSPAATASGKIGATDVTIKYSSPAVKGRTIWGGLEPYGKVWRAGANEATTVEFSKPVKVEGKALPAGTYSLFMIPTEKDWTVIFNKTAKQWGAYEYDEKQDALRVTVKPRKSNTLTERLAYEVTPNGLVLRWEYMEVPVAVK